MNLLITGGAGFCGLNIAEQALRSGFNVVIYGVSAPANFALDYLKKLPGTINVVTADVCDTEMLNNVMEQYEISHIIHAAAVTAALDSEIKGTENILNVNVLGTINVLEAALTFKVKRVIYLSSGSVFGQDKFNGDLYSYKLDEVNDIPIPSSVYGISKYAAERLSLRYRYTRGLNVLVARLGVVFGRWEHDTGVRDTLSIPWNLMKLASLSKKAKIFADYPKDWVYIVDVAKALISIITNENKNISQPIYHISSGRSWSVVDWCLLLQKQFPGFDFELVSTIENANVGISAPTPRPIFSIEHIKNDFGFTPQFGLEESFIDYLDWYKNIDE